MKFSLVYPKIEKKDIYRENDEVEENISLLLLNSLHGNGCQQDLIVKITMTI